MSKLIAYREKQHLTQKELSDKSGVSVRTIQRIESGTAPKGYTLKSLANALNIKEEDLLDQITASDEPNLQIIKWINFSSLLFFIPFANIVLPLLIAKRTDQVNELTKQIVCLQIVWTAASVVLSGISPFLVGWVGASRQLTLQLIIVSFLVNLFIILRNAAELQRNNTLRIKLNFRLI